MTVDLSALTVPELDALLDQVLARIRAVPHPELRVIGHPEQAGDLECPLCHHRHQPGADELGPIAVDVSIRHTDGTVTDHAGGSSVSFDYGHTEDYDGLGYRCAGCEQLVSLPDGWSEVCR